ncbi:hypothetical protein GCM10023340_19560 [Nocardioides marinquilinus]|uniref:Uncharacterized protein n=1 Tax=Nocardioides marinquilinus TaxID=1210400 RepID=A0ABP9PQC7_9ACTN
MDFYERQRFELSNLPGGSLADQAFMDQWVERARIDDRQYVERWVRDRRDQNRAKAADALDRLDKLQDEFLQVRKQAERNEVPYADLAKLQRRLISDRIMLEKVLESLQASVANMDAMQADPTGYMTAFYDRYPALQGRRPNLRSDLAEDQRRRGVEALI